ncbi:MAG: flagellar type III secretion system protein FliR [Ruminiclostridium sp.]|nr:flagellar type III secretion system protein FliR [Ruminiclostridium sp.]
MTGLFVVAPIFGRRNIPAYLKIGFSLLTAIILVNTVQIPSPDTYDSMLQVALIIIKEFIVGITIGFVAYLVFTAIYVAGEIIDMQIGFGVVNVIDPISNIQVPITSNIYFILTMLVYLSVNGHHALIKALFDSYTIVPLGHAVFSASIMENLMGLFGNIFTIGFKIAAPIIAAILITDIALGTISRMVPQLNVFVIGMPLKILVGIVILLVTVPMFLYVLEGLFKVVDAGTINYIKDISPE